MKCLNDGLNERLNQTLVNKIRYKINENKGKKSAWTTIAQDCTKKYNETEHTVTKFVPKYLLEGADIRILPKELKQKTANNLMIDRNTAVENTMKSHNYNKKQFDKYRKEHKFNVDWVYVENGNRLNRKIGPYQILEKISTSIYRIDTSYNRNRIYFTSQSLFQLRL